MKFVLIFLAFVALVNGHEFEEILAKQERSLSEKIEGAIEAAKVQMPCGFPSLGIPPMAPLKLEHKEIKTQGDTLALQLLLDKTKVYGLNDFDIVDFKISALLSKITFKFHWHHVSLRTLYDVLLELSHGVELPARFGREGKAEIGIKDFVVWGTCKYSLGVIGGGGLRLKQFNLYAQVGEVDSAIEGLSSLPIVNRKINEIVEELIVQAINENTENIATLSNEYAVPVINDRIGDKTLGDLIGLIGGSDDDDDTKEPCVPPPDDED